MQTKITEQVISYFSNHYDLNIDISNIEIKLPNKIKLEEIFIPQENGDTLVYSDQILAKISDINFKEKSIIISNILLKKPNIYISTDSSGTYNFQYLIEKFQKPKENNKTKKQGFDIYCNDFLFEKSNISLNKIPSIETPGKFNSKNISVNDFTIGINDFKLEDDNISLAINQIHFKEKSGFELQDLKANIELTDTLFNISDVHLKTSHSHFNASVIEIAILDTTLDNIFEDIKVDVEVESSIIHINDAAYFIKDLKGINQKVKLSAKLTGTLDNIQLKNFIFNYGYDTRLLADVSINGLPELNETFVFGQIHELNVSIRDLETIPIPPFKNNKTLNLPNNIKHVRKLNFKGDLVGMFNDLVANGRFSSNYGNIKTDLALISDFKNKKYKFNGDIAIEHLELGQLISKEDILGKLDLSANVNGMVDSLGKYDIALSSIINQADFKQYPYSNINLAGRITNNSFNGEIVANDPNFQMEFLGGYKLTDNTPEIDFRADIFANLDELNLDTLDASAGLIIYANGSGNDFNNMTGDIQASNIFYNRGDKKVKMNSLLINSLNILDEQMLSIKSDYFNITANGYFQTADFITALSTLAYQYLPVLNKKNREYNINSTPGIINLQAELFNLKPLTDFFVPKMNIPESLSISGKLNGNSDIYNVNLTIPKFQIDTLYSEDIELAINANKSDLNVDLLAKEIRFRNNQFFENFTLKTKSLNDSTHVNIHWDNQDSIRYYGDLTASILLDRNLSNKIGVNTHFYASDIILRNETWHLNETQIRIDTTEFNFGNIKLYNDDQEISIEGTISENPHKELLYKIKNFDISILNPLFIKKGFVFDGILNSIGKLNNTYNDINFNSGIEFNNLKINDEDLDKVSIYSFWDYKTDALNLNGNSKFILFKGFINPKKNNLDVDLKINGFELKVLNDYLIKTKLIDIAGKLNGNITVDGSLKSPNFHGALDFDNSALTYEFLMSRFNINDSVYIYTDSIVLKNFTIKDKQGGKGYLNGKFTHNMFKNIKYDFNVKLDNYHILNTKETDNPKYYGSAYISTNANITGSTKDITINIPEGKTEKNTVFVLPMSNRYEAKSLPWITFLNDSSDNKNSENLIPRKPFDVTFLMNMKVTPDAEARLVFDPQVGDMIKAKSLGDISIEVYPDGVFSMKGELEIKGGDYLFTLQNIINKRFILQEGGYIFWDGDPTKGTLDIQAKYPLSAPLYDIMIGIDTSNIYKRSTNVECIMNMKGSLLNPDIKFSIKVPNADEKAKQRIASLSNDEINKQVLTLLVLNRFYTPDDMQIEGENRGASNIVGKTSFEMLSNQVSNWLSQISDDFDIGVNYRPGDAVTSEELELILSTQILNDRVLINGNVGVGQHGKTNNSNTDIVGDVEVQVKINKSGNLRVKGFTRANSQTQQEYDYGPTTQGIGIFHTASFNTLPELIQQYIASFKNKEATEVKSPQVPENN